MKKYILTISILGFLSLAYGQQRQNADHWVDLAVSTGQSQGAGSGSYVHQWWLDKKHKWGLGAGLRFTSYLGYKKEFITAPSSLTSGSNSPFILFKENIEANIDTITVQRPQVNALNLSFNAGYQVLPRFMLGFNIDVVGFSFGRSTNAIYTMNESSSSVNAKPAGFNLLLISDNDLGNLNSEFFIRYSINRRWSLRVLYQFLFTEYKTTVPVQYYPEPNDRFRNKVSALGIGLSYHLKK